MDIRAAALRAGDLNHKLTLFAPAGTRSEGSPENLATGIPAKIEALPFIQRREYLAIGGIQAQTIYNVTIRYREDIDAELVLIEECCTERRFQILSIIPTNRREALELTCTVAG